MRGLTKSEYDIKARELKERQHELAIRINNHEAGDDSFKTTVESLFSLASRAYDIFMSSKIEQKRQLIAFVFSNLMLRGAKLEYSLRNPFHLMAGRRTHQDWLGD